MENKNLNDYLALAADYFDRCEAHLYDNSIVPNKIMSYKDAARKKFLHYALNTGMAAECYLMLYKKMRKY